MHVQRYQYQLRLPWASNPDGYYYWTNQFYWDLDNPPPTGTTRTAINTFMEVIHCTFVEQNRYRIFDPALSSTVVSEGSMLNENCTRPVESGYSPFDTVLMHWLVAGERKGYTRLRMPVQGDEQEDGRLHPDVVSSVYNAAMFYMWQARVCTRLGERIDLFEVDPLVRGWQFRHGTKRRQRKVFGPP